MPNTAKQITLSRPHLKKENDAQHVNTQRLLKGPNMKEREMGWRQSRPQTTAGDAILSAASLGTRKVAHPLQIYARESDALARRILFFKRRLGIIVRSLSCDVISPTQPITVYLSISSTYGLLLRE